jgi:hypothetical protein
MCTYIYSHYYTIQLQEGRYLQVIKVMMESREISAMGIFSTTIQSLQLVVMCFNLYCTMMILRWQMRWDQEQEITNWV